MYCLSGFCSLCLVRTQNLKNILTQDTDGIIVQEKLKVFLLELVIFKPNIPKYICYNCLENVDNIHKFRQRCLENIATLIKCVKKIEVQDELHKKSATLTHNKDEENDSLKLQNQNTSEASVRIYTENDMLKNIPQSNIVVDRIFIKTEAEETTENSLEDVVLEQKHKNILSTFQSPYEVFKEFNEEKYITEDKNIGSSNNISEEHHIVEPDVNTILKVEHSDSEPELLQETEFDKEFFTSDAPWSASETDNNVLEATKIQDTIATKGLNTNIRKFATATPSEKRIRNTKRKYLCTQCHKAFISPSHLEIHRRVHSGVRPFKCTFCHKTFNQSNDLKRHMRTHTGEKPYACDVCSKTFTQLSHLREHVRIHNNIRPYKCSLCSKAFTQSGNLTMHMRTHR